MITSGQVDLAKQLFVQHLDRTAYFEEQAVWALNTATIFYDQISKFNEILLDKVREDSNNPTKSSALRLKICGSDLSARVKNSLDALGVKTVADLTKMTKRDVMSMHAISKISLADIEAFLEREDLSLAD